MTPADLRRAGLVVAGLTAGVLGLALGLWLYLEAARVDEVRTAIGAHLRLAREAIERVEIVEHDAIRFDLRDIVLYDERGDTILAAPRVSLVLDATSLDEDRPAIEFHDVEVREPFARLIQGADGVWNVARTVRMTAAGAPVETADARPLLFRDLRIVDGRMTLAVISEPPTPEPGFVVNLPFTRLGSDWYQLYRATDVQARIPSLLVGGAEGWRLDVGSLTAQVEEPALRIAELQGFAEGFGEDGVRFGLEALRVGESVFSGAGVVRFPEPGPLYDFQLDFPALRLADARPIFPALPEEGAASFTLGVESIDAERLVFDVSGLELEALDSRILGAIRFSAGGDLPPDLLYADLELDPLQLIAVERLGLVADLPLVGPITGRLTTVDAATGLTTVDLAASLVPRDRPDQPPSAIMAFGSLTVGDEAEAFRLTGVTVAFQPLHLAALRGFVPPERQDLLRGEARGSVVLSGTLGDLQLDGGDVALTVGEAPPTRLVDLTGRIGLVPALQYEVRARAQPLALATLTELFPALPFETAALAGPIELVGDRDRIEMRADLAGAMGSLRVAGSAVLGDTPRFDVEGSLTAFAAGMVLRPDLPIEGPLTGTFAARGTTGSIAFEADLRQVEGRFAIEGTLVTAVDPPGFQLGGELFDFRIGAVLGEPSLFPDPMTGRISLAGGGGEPYRFDFDLEGGVGRLDLAGYYRPGAIPSYEISGFVAGLDVSRLPSAPPLPPTALSGTVEIRGEGIDPETLEGTLAFNGRTSTLAGVPLDTAAAHVQVRGGVMIVDTLHVQLERTRLAAAGSWGLTRPAEQPLRFSFVSPDLRVLAPAVIPGEAPPAPLSGELAVDGEVSGSWDRPELAWSLRGRDLQFDEWRAATLSATGRVSREPLTGWGGRLTLVGDDLELPQGSIATLRLEASGSEASLALGLFARRDARSELALSGMLELDGLVPRGINLQSMLLRLEDTEWTLLRPARVRRAPAEGLVIDDLALERRGEQEGFVRIHGMIPPTGATDLVVQIANFDLADLRRLSPTVPALEGVLTLNAILEGSVDQPELSVEAQLDQILYEGVLTERVTFDGIFSGRRFTATADAFIEGQRLFLAELDVPMLLSLQELVPRLELLPNDPLTITVAADSLPFSLVAAMVPGLADGRGVARAQIAVGGTLDAPVLDGYVRLAGGEVDIEPASVRFTGIEADVALEQNRVLVRSLTINSGGTLVADGRIDFPRGAPPQLGLNVTMSDFRLINDPGLASVISSASLAVSGPITSPLIGGRVVIRESTLYVPELAAEPVGLELGYLDVADMDPFGDELPLAPPFLGDVRLDGLQVALEESVWLESNEMRVQITGDLIVFRTGEDLRIFGALQAVRGTYALEVSAITREFDVIRGRVQFFGTGDLNPSLDILAGYRVRSATVGRGGDLTVLAQVTGTMLTPRLQLTSDAPVPLSETDLISYLIFGQPNFELGGVTRTFAEQVLIQEVVGGILATELERPILRAGLCDWVRVRPGMVSDFRGLFGSGPLAGAAIECGWELAPDFFMTGQTGIGGLFGGDFMDWRLGVEWQIDNEWMWEASYGSVERNELMRIFAPGRQRYQLSTDLRRQWEYGRPRRETIIDLLPDDPAIDPTVQPLAPAPPILDP